MSDVLPGLPQLDGGYPLDNDLIKLYQANGHVRLNGLCSPQEAAAYREVIHRAEARLNHEVRPLEERDTYGKAFLQTMNLWTADEDVRRFVFAKRFAQVAAKLMGVTGVRLYHDQSLNKEAGGGHTPWHQDYYYWPLDTEHTITMWMPLVDIQPEMGTLTFASKSHREGYLGPLEISDKSEEVFDAMVAEKGFQLDFTGAMKAGDATFHSGTTLHCAPGNHGSYNREVMTIIYFADGTTVMEPDNPNRVADIAEWLPGLKPGELAASRLNPLLFP